MVGIGIAAVEEIVVAVVEQSLDIDCCHPCFVVQLAVQGIASAFAGVVVSAAWVVQVLGNTFQVFEAVDYIEVVMQPDWRTTFVAAAASAVVEVASAAVVMRSTASKQHSQMYCQMTTHWEQLRQDWQSLPSNPQTEVQE